MNTRRLRFGAVLGAALFLHACSGPTENSPPVAELIVHTQISGTAIASLTLEVSAPDIPSPVTQNLALQDGTATATIIVPAGSARRFVISARNAAGITTHRGERTVDIHPGGSTNVAIDLVSLTGSSDVTVRIGSYLLQVSPRDSTLTVGDTLVFVATVTRPDGSTLPDAEIVWASTVPPIARVTQQGVVTGVSVGTSQIVANFRGIAVRADLHVTH
jgi:hypothetical protein